MTKKEIISFVAISILLLIAMFLFLVIGENLIGYRVNEISPQEGNDVVEVNKEIIDPLITPASVLYKSLIKITDPKLGGVKADLIIMEFGDFQCPYCANLYRDLREAIEESEDRVQLVWKDFPNPVHLQARNSALAARCAQDQGKFWEYHDYLFANQDNLSREIYNKIALELDLNLAQFNKCLDSEEKIELVGEGFGDAQKLGVDATPYLFIGNKSFDYALTKEELNKVVEAELK